MSHKKYSLSLLFVFVFSLDLFASAQNKFISKKFHWKVTHTEHFDVYSSQGSDRLLPLVCQHLENSYAKVTGLLNIPVKSRIPFFLFLTHNDFEQNNIVDVGEGTGGVTEAFKDRFLVFNDGTQNWLEHVIRHEFTHEVQFHVLYAGFWRSAKILKSVFYPLWFMEGMAEYGSGEIDDPTREMLLRDAITSGQWIPLTFLHGFNHMKPNQVTLAYKIGNAALLYIAQEYGKEKVSELLTTIAKRFDMNGALEEVIGLNLTELDKKLKGSLQEKYEEEALSLKEPSFYGKALTQDNAIYPVYESHPTFFSDGKRFAYLSDQNGATDLFICDLTIGRSLPMDILKKFSGDIENIHRFGSALSISSDGRYILFAGERHERDYLYFYDLKREKLRRISIPLDSLSSPQLSPNGSSIVFAGMKDGVTDLYSCDLYGKGLTQLTSTFEDENDVRFLAHGEQLLFTREEKKEKESYPRNLYLLDLHSGKETQLTYGLGKIIQCANSPSGNEIVFVSDRDGIFNLYSLSLKTREVLQLTRVIGGNFYPSFSPDGANLLFVSHRAGQEKIYTASWKELGTDPRLKPSEELGTDPKLQNKGDLGSVPNSNSPSEAYRFRASTDFFFPLVYYSSLDGLFVSSYWRASEMLGNHELQTAVSYASKLDFLNYSVIYNYRRFKPQFFVGFQGDTQENVLLTSREVRREDAQFVGVRYPLSRFDKVEEKVLTTQRRIQLTDDPLVSLKTVGRENVSLLSYSRDITQGRYLQTTQGYRLSASIEESNELWGSELDYRSFLFDYEQFFPLHRESSFAMRLFAGSSFGQDPQTFRTGGADLLRGYGRFDANASARRFALSNLEFRFPLFFDLNYHLFFFPDFLFKNVYGVTFMDSGILWNDSKVYEHSLGVGLRFQTFVLQTFPVILQLDWARRTKDGEQTFYFGFGPNF